MRSTFEALEFRTVFAGVRPARLAVLIYRNDPYWQETCRRVLECLSSIWGGKNSLLIPTDGKRIEPMFWELLEAFDPDYICQYQPTMLDLKLADPEQYDALLQGQLKNLYPNQSPSGDQREEVEEALFNAQIWPVEISLELQKELKIRLAPFFFEENVIHAASFSTRTAPSYPLTSVSTILPFCDHPGRLSIVGTNSDRVPPLWIESVVGATYEGQLKLLQTLGIHAERVVFDDSQLHDLFDIVLRRGIDPFRNVLRTQMKGESSSSPIDYIRTSPFEFSMLALSQYSQTAERRWEAPAVVVLGKTIDDFTLYFDLSRIRPNVYWLLPDWISTYKAASERAKAGGAAIASSEQHALRFGIGVLAEVRAGNIKNIDFVTVSHGAENLEEAISVLDTASYGGIGPSFRTLGRIPKNITDFLSHPRVVYNTDNFAIPTTQQVQGGRAVGFFPTPKPKGFTRIVPYDHRWITEVRVDGITYPRHPALGTWMVQHRLIGTQEVRSGAFGLCYVCPSTAYFGGDVDTILVRPEIHIPDAAAVFQCVAGSSGWSTKLSDKGFLSHDTVQKMGGVELTASLFRTPKRWAVLEEYLRDRNDESAGGIYLASDRRRYLDLATIVGIMGDAQLAAALVDSLVGQRLLHRGTILKCEYCRTADWFSLGDLGGEFRCKRCRRKQTLLSKHSLKNDEPTWYYQLDEIAYLGLRNDMHVPILALDYLRRKSSAFSYVDELEIWKPGLSKPFIEIDLCCICDGILTIGEAKTTERIEGGGKRERRSLQKYREAALGLAARQFVLATTKAWANETIANASQAFIDTGVEVRCLAGEQLLVVS